MTSTQLFRISGLALLVGAVAFAVHILARSAVTAGSDPATVYREGLWVLINSLGVLGALLVLLGLPELYAGIAGRAGWPGLTGVVLIALAWMFLGFFLSLYAVLVAPWLADRAPSLVAASARIPTGFIIAFLAALVAQLAGTVLLAIPFISGRIGPRWVGYVLPASSIWMVLGDLLAPNGPAANLAINLVSNLGPVLFVVALGRVGASMWSDAAEGRFAD